MKRLIVGISGASGMPYARRLLQVLPEDYELHLVASEIAKDVFYTETGFRLDENSLAEWISHPERIHFFNEKDFFAPAASGSFNTEGMVVIPCSMKTLAGIACGYANTLIERAADVTLKQKRKLVLVVRETPYNRIHLQNMLRAQEAGAVILPASPGFYTKPESIEQLIDFVVARAMDMLEIPQTLVKGWQEK